MLRQDADLPRCALSKVARRLFKGRIDPSSKDGIEPLPHSFQFIHTFYHAYSSSRSLPDSVLLLDVGQIVDCMDLTWDAPY